MTDNQNNGTTNENEITEFIAQDYRICTLLSRIIKVVEDENGELEKTPQFDFSVSSINKGRCFYELFMLFRDIDCTKLSAVHLEKLYELREKLTINVYRLDAYLEAGWAVANLLKNSIEDIDADGTYSSG